MPESGWSKVSHAPRKPVEASPVDGHRRPSSGLGTRMSGWSTSGLAVQETVSKDATWRECGAGPRSIHPRWTTGQRPLRSDREFPIA